MSKGTYTKEALSTIGRGGHVKGLNTLNVGFKQVVTKSELTCITHTQSGISDSCASGI